MGLQNQLNLELIPAILAKDKKMFIQRLRLFERYFNLIQIDCIDGKFAKNVSYYNAGEISSIQTSAQWELHLMINNPKEVIQEWKDDMRLERVVISYESYESNKAVKDALEALKKTKLSIGLAINPDTSEKVLEPLIEFTDYVLVLGVHPGFSGQKFIKSTYKKIKRIRKEYLMLPIEVDGGVTAKNAKKLIKSGATMLATASAITQGEIENNIAQFHKIIDKQKINLL